MNTPTLETERLLLRKFTSQDIEALYTILQDKETNTFLPWFPLQSLNDARAFYEQHYDTVYQQTQGYQYAICFHSDPNPIGYIGISMDDSHDLGYGLHKKYWHKGIATEACLAVVRQAAADGLLYLTATHDRNNPRSGKVMMKAGFRYQYSYEEQWQPKNIPVIFRLYQLNLDGTQERVYRKYWESSAVHFIETELGSC